MKSKIYGLSYCWTWSQETSSNLVVGQLFLLNCILLFSYTGKYGRSFVTLDISLPPNWCGWEVGGAKTMSVPEPPIQSQDSVCQIPDRKPRPSIPKKPDSESLPLARSPQEVSKVTTSGNVKNIVSKFNRERTFGNEQPTEGGTDPPRKPKRAPTVRPKPRERSRSTRASQTCPLPARKSRIFQESPPEAQVETQVTEPPAKQDDGRPGRSLTHPSTLTLATLVMAFSSGRQVHGFCSVHLSQLIEFEGEGVTNINGISIQQHYCAWKRAQPLNCVYKCYSKKTHPLIKIIVG